MSRHGGVNGPDRRSPWPEILASHGGAAAAAYGRGGGAAGVREPVARGNARELRPQRSFPEPRDRRAHPEHHGAHGRRVADVLLQAVGLAAALLPAVLRAWAFRMLLNRGVAQLTLRSALLLPLLVLGAIALNL